MSGGKVDKSIAFDEQKGNKVHNFFHFLLTWMKNNVRRSNVHQVDHPDRAGCTTRASLLKLVKEGRADSLMFEDDRKEVTSKVRNALTR
ncbi:hypothetical protein OROHE_022339 [Orobanche hederae]